MEARSDIAARVHEIAPFHVMEVQTAARALEAAGRSVIHMEIGEPDFPTPAPVLACFAPETLATLEARRGEFQARRDFLVPALRALGFSVPVMPTRGFFVYADCSRFGMDSQRFALEALNATAVTFTPGVDFGRHRPEAHVRFAYTIGRPLLEGGLRRLAAWLPALGRS